jgi:hypothetical protein
MTPQDGMRGDVPPRTISWRQPECQAAAVNGALIVLAPAALALYMDFKWTAIRPTPPAVPSSALRVLPVLLWLLPVSFLVVWRTYVHACAYRRKPTTVWRGPAESGAVAAWIALILLVPATAPSWGSQPFLFVVAYVAFYVGAALLAGLGVGLLLAATGLLVLYFL